MGETLIGNEITKDILTRLARLEAILLCKHCGGFGTVMHRSMGEVTCPICEGTGNRLDALECRHDQR